MAFTHQSVPGTRSASVVATPVTQEWVLFPYSIDYFVGEAAAMDLVTETWKGPVPSSFNGCYKSYLLRSVEW